jgi:hypothetical protein
MDRFPSIPLDFTDWTIWLATAIGVVVAIVTMVLGRRYLRLRRLRNGVWTDEPSWDDLLELVRQHKRTRALAGFAREEDNLPPSQLLKDLMPGLSSRWRGSLNALSKQLAAAAETEQAGPVRWGNPTEVYFTSATCVGAVHGIVVNRSAVRLAILADKKVEPGTALQIRSAEAPDYVPTVDMEVEDCQKIRRNFLLACHFCGEVPWNVRAWFG